MFIKKSKLIRVLSISLLGAAFISGCAVKTGNEKLEDVSNEKVSEFLKKDVTTKNQVKENLGEPQKVDFMSNGLEKWEYEHIRKQAKGINYVPVANWFVSGTNDTKKTLVVLFDGDIVKNYSVATAEGETKGGLFQ